MLRPGRRAKEKYRGLGCCEQEKLEAPRFRAAMWRILEHIRAVGWCPADWHHAMAFASKKPNNKVGPEGVRVMRCFDGVALS
eukprot:8010221-Lingulodinium_polyedra.AAC.1